MHSRPDGLRAAKPADLERLLALEALFPEEDRLSIRSYRRFLSRPDCVSVIVGDKDDLAAASVLLTRKGSTIARLYSLIVNPDYRRRGHAAHLLNFNARLAQQAGCVRIRLEVRASNVSAQSLYAKSGFHVSGRRPNFYGDGEAAILMFKTIAPVSHHS